MNKNKESSNLTDDIQSMTIVALTVTKKNKMQEDRLIVLFINLKMKTP